jgi:uncharacterized lipoprotein YajG
MSIFKKTLSCVVLAALGTCALAGCGRQDTSNEATTSARKPSTKAPLHPNRHRLPMLPEYNPQGLRM